LYPHPSREIRTIGNIVTSQVRLRCLAVHRSGGKTQIFQRGVLAEVQRDLVPFSTDPAAITPGGESLFADLATVLELEVVQTGDHLPVVRGRVTMLASALN